MEFNWRVGKMMQERSSRLYDLLAMSALMSKIGNSLNDLGLTNEFQILVVLPRRFACTESPNTDLEYRGKPTSKRTLYTLNTYPPKHKFWCVSPYDQPFSRFGVAPTFWLWFLRF